MVEVDDFVVTSTSDTGVQTIEADLPFSELDATPASEPVVAEDVQPEQKIDKRTLAGKKQSIQAEIDALTAAKYQTKREAEAAKAELDALKSERAQISQVQPSQSVPTPNGADPEPQESQFDDYGKFVKAQARWEARQEFREQQQAAQRVRQEAEVTRSQRERIESFSKRIEASKGGDPAFLDKISPDVLALKPFHALLPGEQGGPLNAMAEEILNSPVAPQVMLHLTQHPEDFQRIATLPPRELVREMAKIEARFEVASPSAQPKAPVISQAKPPIKPMGSAPSAVDDGEISDDLPVEEHIRRMNARDRAARRGL